MIPFHNGSSLKNCAIVRFFNQPISEEADRRIALPHIPIASLTHRETINESINLISESGWAAHRETTSEISELINLISKSRWQSTIKREFIDGSGIAPDLFEATIDFIEDTGYWEPNELLGQRVSRQWKSRKPHSYGVLAVLSHEDSSPWQAKPQNPRLDGKGKVVKYESIAGSGLRAFLPAIPRSVRRKISQRYGVKVPEFGSFWDWVKDHPEIQLILTEGGKKSLSLLSQGYVAIALYGVDGGGLFNEWIGGEKLRKLKPELIADLQPFAVSGRPVTLAFDQDKSAKTRSQVNAALDRLGGLLRAAGCMISIAQWDGQDGRCKGVG